MPEPLHSKIANLIPLSRSEANKNIREWLDEGDPSAPDLDYVIRFLRTRDRGPVGGDSRIGMAALFIAMPTLVITVFTGFATENVVAQLVPYTMLILAFAGAGVLWTLGFMLLDVFRSAHDTKLLSEIELRLEMARRTPRPSPNWRQRCAALLVRVPGPAHHARTATGLSSHPG